MPEHINVFLSGLYQDEELIVLPIQSSRVIKKLMTRKNLNEENTNYFLSVRVTINVFFVSSLMAKYSYDE